MRYIIIIFLVLLALTLIAVIIGINLYSTTSSDKRVIQFTRSSRPHSKVVNPYHKPRKDYRGPAESKQDYIESCWEEIK